MGTPAHDYSVSSLRPALTRRLLGRATISGSITLPAVPAMIDDYVTMCDTMFSGFGVSSNSDQLRELRSVLEGQLAIAFEASARSEIIISYESPLGHTVSYHVSARWSSLEAAYDNWVSTREPPLFGKEPDAMVMQLAASANDAAGFPVLDLGAGTGRNALPLARRGHPVDAVELAPMFTKVIRAEAALESLDVRVIERDVFDAGDVLRRDYGMVVLSEVASDFRSTDELRRVFALASQHLAPGGLLVLNTFVARDGYAPDAAARELGQQCYSGMFTRPELADESAAFPLALEADVSVLEFEKTHMPADAWPPTSWYKRWAGGLDVFEVEHGVSPIELRWFVYRKTD
jgi:SAM-dependent methyltransferase